MDNIMVNQAGLEPSVAIPDAGIADTGGWTVDDAVDPITDARLIRAGTKVQGAVDDIEVLASCNPGEPSITYAVAGFDKEGEGARLDTDFVGASPFNRLIYRPDSRPAQVATTMNPQYSNQAQITGDQGFDAANARQLTLRIQFSNANETYIIDQSSMAFQKVVRRCLQARAANTQLQQRRAAALAQEQEQQATTQPDPGAIAPEALTGDLQPLVSPETEELK